MSVVNVMRSRNSRSAVNGQPREEMASGSTGLPKRPYGLPHNYTPPQSGIALSSRKKPRFDTINHDSGSNRLVLGLEENSQQEQSSSQLPVDFLELLPPDERLAVDSSSICMVPFFPVGQPGSGKGVNQVCRQFWKAGDYTGTRSDRRSAVGGMDHVRVHPKFLHSNATSHKWALGAVAELLDNALDEVVHGATAVSIDMLTNPRNGEPMLLIEDDGGGMDPDSIRHCTSLGYSAKSKIANTIGQYGNGFKTSTMRLGADVIVFSRCYQHGRGSPTESIGLLSYTFLRDTGQDDIIVPIVDYEMQPFGLRKLMRGSVCDWNKNMETITQWSPYSTEAQLLDQFNGMSCQGTRVVVYNLWEDEQGLLELDFMTTADDIQVRGVNRDEKNIKMAEKYPNCKHYLTYRHSLRSYASILYLRLPPQFKIYLRGKEVQHHRLSEDLMLTEEVTYKPQRRVEHPQIEAGEMKAVVTIGFVKDAKEHIDVQGFSVYHKNRLIKPFWRIWNTPDTRGRGIIGVLEANFVEPAHDKQGFERTIVLARLETRLIEMQKNYWNKHYYKVGYVNKSLKKNGKLIPRSADCQATDDFGLEDFNDASSVAQDLEVQSGQPLDESAHDQVESLLSPARLEWEAQSVPASVEIIQVEDCEVQSGSSLAVVQSHSKVESLFPTMPDLDTQVPPTSIEITASGAHSELHHTGQMLPDPCTAKSITHMQDVPDQSPVPQQTSFEKDTHAEKEALSSKATAVNVPAPPETSFEKAMHAEKEALSSKAMVVTVPVPLETDKSSRPVSSGPTNRVVTEIIDQHSPSIVQDKQILTMESDLHILPVSVCQRGFATDMKPPTSKKPLRSRTSTTSHTNVTDKQDLYPSGTVDDKHVVTIMESAIQSLPVTPSPKSLATDSEPLMTDEAPMPRSDKTMHTEVANMLDLDPSRTEQEKQLVMMESNNIHILPVSVSPRSANLSSADIEQVGGSSRSLRNGHTSVQEASNISRRTEVDAGASLRTLLLPSKMPLESTPSILESNGYLSQSLVSEMGGEPEEQPSSSEKVVIVPSMFPKAIEGRSPKNTSLTTSDSQRKHKFPENTVALFPQKTADSAVQETGEIQQGAVDSGVDAWQGPERVKLASLDDECHWHSYCEHCTNKELISQFSCMEQEVESLQRNIAEVVGEAEQLREQLKLEHQLVEMEMEELKRQLHSAQCRLENLKFENIDMKSNIMKG